MDRDSFLARFGAPKVIEVTLDDGSTWFVRKLSQADVEAMAKRYGGGSDKQIEGLRFLVARGLVDRDGTRMFADTDLDKLANVDFEVIKQLAGEIGHHSGTGTDAKKA